MNLSNIRLAEQVRTLLVHAGFPEAIVAGGFLRDTLLGIEPKDIDVFIGNKTMTSEALVSALHEALGGYVKVEFDVTYSAMEVDRILAVDSPAYPFPIQVIEMKPGLSPVEHARRHDFGICQVWIGSHGLDATIAFTEDRKRKLCTLVHCENADEHARSMRRWERLKDKLVGFQLVDETEWANGASLAP
jgi:hypothetical protein